MQQFGIKNSQKNMKLLSILLVLFVISQVFGGYSRCLKRFKGKDCDDERDCGPYGSCQIVGLVLFWSDGE